MKKLLILIFSLTLLSCAEKEDSTVLLPFSAENQTCITAFLRSGNFDFKVVNIPFEIDSPEPYAGVIKLTPAKNRDMRSVYNTIKYDCYPTLKVSTTVLTDDWESISNDLKDISEGKNTTISRSKVLYIKVDASNKTYSIFQR
jgi:hypothetical protein